MKKLLLIGLTVVALALPATAATFISQPFLNAKMLYLDNDNTTNSFTNLSLFAQINSLAGASNRVGSIFTNNVGISNKVAAGNSHETFNCLGSAQLWPKQDGSWQQPTWAITSYQTVWGTTNHIKEEVQTTGYDTDQSLLIEVIGESGWDGGMTLVFYPGYTEPGTGIMHPVTGGSAPWSLTIPHAALTGRSCIITNVPTYKWPGAERLFLYTVTNNDSTADDHVSVLRVDLIGWKP